MSKTILKELKCPECGKLLAKSNNETEVTCTKCKAIRRFNSEQSADTKN